MRDVPIMSARIVPEIDWRGVPANVRVRFKNKVSAVCKTEKECADLIHWFGDATFCPFKPVLLVYPFPGVQPGLIVGHGYATAAELQDCAVTWWATTKEKIEKTGKVLDYDSLREKHGLMRREDVDAAIREALHERIRRHKASPVTDPFRQPDYPRVNGKTVHTVAKIEVPA